MLPLAPVAASKAVARSVPTSFDAAMLPASMVLVMAPDPMDVAFPTLVTGPVKLAFVVTDAAFPLMLPLIVFVTDKFASVPTDVRDEAKTFDARAVPVNVTADAGTMMFAEPSKETPLMVCGNCRAAAVAAFPVVLPDDPETFPVTLPVRFPVTLPVKLPVAVPIFGETSVGLLDRTTLPLPVVPFVKSEAAGCAAETAPVVEETPVTN